MRILDTTCYFPLTSVTTYLLANGDEVHDRQQSAQSGYNKTPSQSRCNGRDSNTKFLMIDKNVDIFAYFDMV